MKKILYFTIVVFAICSCNPIPNKPIYEELTIDELSKAIKKDSSFGEFYQAIRDDRGVRNMNDIQKAKYKDVTYRRAYKFIKFYEDYEHLYELYSTARTQWEKEYASTIKSTDSLISVMKAEKEKAFAEVNKIASLELTDIQHKYKREREWRSSIADYVEEDVPYCELTIKCNLSVPKIDEMNVWLYCWGKNDYPGPDEFYFYSERDIENGQYRNISFYGVPDFFQDYYSIAEFSKDCDYKLRIDRLIIGNDTIEPDFQDYDDLDLAKYETRRFEHDWMELAKSKVNPDIIDLWEYCSKIREQELREFDPLVYELTEEL